MRVGFILKNVRLPKNAKSGSQFQLAFVSNIFGENIHFFFKNICVDEIQSSWSGKFCLFNFTLFCQKETRFRGSEITNRNLQLSFF